MGRRAGTGTGGVAGDVACPFGQRALRNGMMPRSTSALRHAVRAAKASPASGDSPGARRRRPGARPRRDDSDGTRAVAYRRQQQARHRHDDPGRSHAANTQPAPRIGPAMAGSGETTLNA